MLDIQISHKRFAELTSLELHDLIKLRVDVFVVEQNCAYPELDGRDTEPTTTHTLARASGELIGYARALSPREEHAAFRIGRVVTAKEHRRTGVARAMMQALIEQGCTAWPNTPIELSAQTVAVNFYRSLGFSEVSAEYLEDGIAHVDMLYRV